MCTNPGISERKCETNQTLGSQLRLSSHNTSGEVYERDAEIIDIKGLVPAQDENKQFSSNQSDSKL